METKPSLFSKKHFKPKKGVPNIPQKSRPAVSTDWTEEIARLEAFFACIVLPKQPLKLNPWTTIADFPVCIESGLNFVKANNGNRIFHACLEQLQEIEMILLPENERVSRKAKMQLVTTPQKQRTKSKNEKSTPVDEFVL